MIDSTVPPSQVEIARARLNAILIIPFMSGDLVTATNYHAQGIDLSGAKAKPFAEAWMELVRFKQ
jgi:hypothetical protein